MPQKPAKLDGSEGNGQRDTHLNRTQPVTRKFQCIHSVRSPALHGWGNGTTSKLGS